MVLKTQDEAPLARGRTNIATIPGLPKCQHWGVPVLDGNLAMLAMLQWTGEAPRLIRLGNWLDSPGRADHGKATEHKGPADNEFDRARCSGGARRGRRHGHKSPRRSWRLGPAARSRTDVKCRLEGALWPIRCTPRRRRRGQGTSAGRGSLTEHLRRRAARRRAYTSLPAVTSRGSVAHSRGRPKYGLVTLRWTLRLQAQDDRRVGLRWPISYQDLARTTTRRSGSSASPDSVGASQRPDGIFNPPGR